MCASCKGAADRLAKEHASALGKEAIFRAFQVLPLTLAAAADIHIQPEAAVFPEEDGGSEAAKRIDCLLTITATDGSTHLWCIEVLNSKKEEPQLLHAKFRQAVATYDPKRAYLCCFRVSANSDWTVPERLDIFRRCASSLSCCSGLRMCSLKYA